MRAYLTEGASLGELETLERLGADVGLDAARVREVLTTDAFAREVRTDEARARGFGISGVPFFAIDERYGVSGAQGPDVLLAALRQAYEEAGAATVPAPDAGPGCDDGSCAV